MINVPIIDKPAIHRHIKSGVVKGLKVGNLWIITQTSGTPYSKNGVLLKSSILEPVYGYVKNYSKWKKDFSLFIWTNESNHEKVESFLDTVKVERQDLMAVLNKVQAYKYVEQRLV